MKLRRFVFLPSAIASLGVLAPLGRAQSTVASNMPASISEDADLPTIKQLAADVGYTRPTERMKLRSYLFDAFGPYPIVGAAFIAGVNQSEATPPEFSGTDAGSAPKQ